jgi:hypothetical protein
MYLPFLGPFPRLCDRNTFVVCNGFGVLLHFAFTLLIQR